MLLKVLCKYFWKVEPQFKVISNYEQLIEQEAFLLIGDASLMMNTDLINTDLVGAESKPDLKKNLKAEKLKKYIVTDLAQAWTLETGLPFVFAVTVAQDCMHEEGCVDSIDTARIVRLRSVLDAALDWSKEHPEEVAKAAHKRNSTIDVETARDYLKLIQHRFKPEHHQAIELFDRLCDAIRQSLVAHS
jgi:predicted solute-binding protein